MDNPGGDNPGVATLGRRGQDAAAAGAPLEPDPDFEPDDEPAPFFEPEDEPAPFFEPEPEDEPDPDVDPADVVAGVDSVFDDPESPEPPELSVFPFDSPLLTAPERLSVR